jgi:hypothetical protein
LRTDFSPAARFVHFFLVTPAVEVNSSITLHA